MTRLHAVVLALVLGMASLPDSHAYVRLTERTTGKPLFWNPPTVTLTISFPDLPCVLDPVDACFERAARGAADHWHQAEAKFTFTVREALVDPCRSGDGINAVTFKLSLCGVAFPPEMLAGTLNLTIPTGHILESDVIFNHEPDKGFFWDVYEGPQQYVAGTPIYDFYRVAIHEFGHVLGLAHPDDFGQVVRAIMNARSGHLDRLQNDDVRGIHAIYGSLTPPTFTPSAGVLENPGPAAFKSGIGVISGWVCEAVEVSVDIDGGRYRFPVVYGTDRGDTQGVCGDANNGFVTLVNWNLLGVGSHTIRLLADGVEVSTARFTVTTFGQEFLQGAAGTYDLPNFPQSGDTTVIEWEESSQNFVIRGVK